MPLNFNNNNGANNMNTRRRIKLYYHNFYYFLGKNNTIQNIYLAICVLDTLFINYKKAMDLSNIHLISEISININKMALFIIRSYKSAIKNKTINKLNKCMFIKKITSLKNKIIYYEKLTTIQFENAHLFTNLIETGRIKLNNLYAIIDDIIEILNNF